MNESRTDSGNSNASRPLLSTKDIFELSSLQLRARVIGEGVMAGEHRSMRLGASANFAEYKEYTPGDDIRRLDWKAFAKFNRYFIRRYEETTQIPVHLIVDTSASMAYRGGAQGTHHVSKSEYANTLAAGLAWIALSQHDSASLRLFAGDTHTHIAASSFESQFIALLSALEEANPLGETQFLHSIQSASLESTRPSSIILVSDLLGHEPELFQYLGVLRTQGSDVTIVHVMDPEELDFPFDGVVRFEDLESEQTIQVDADAVRDGYLTQLRLFLDTVRSECNQRDLQYQLTSTDQSPIHAIAALLSSQPHGRGR